MANVFQYQSEILAGMSAAISRRQSAEPPAETKTATTIKTVLNVVGASHHIVDLQRNIILPADDADNADGDPDLL